MSEGNGTLHESARVMPGLRFQLPWPMTALEAARWFAVVVPAAVVSTAVVAVVTTAVTDPSVWRLLVPLTWLLVFKVAVLPVLVLRLGPDDVDARWDLWGVQSVQRDRELEAYRYGYEDR